MVYKMVKIPYMRNYWEEKREREIEGKEREMRDSQPPFIFLVDMSTLEHRELRSSVSGFHILSFIVLGARSSVASKHLEFGFFSSSGL